MQQILWFEVALKGILGIALFVMPLSAARLCGLQHPGSGFWPRLVGALLLGLAAGVFIKAEFPTVQGGIGPGGLIATNLAGASALAGALILGKAAPSRRGWFLILIVTILLLALAFVEIAHI